jgi:hypothetical protein
MFPLRFAPGRATALTTVFITGAPPFRSDRRALYPAPGAKATSVARPIHRSVSPHPLDAFAQWLLWEEQANFAGFRTSTRAIDVEVVRVERRRARVRFAAGLSRELRARVVDGAHVLLPKHPLNRDPGVAFADAPAALTWRARFTSSRTLVVEPGDGGAAFAVKLATDHPHADVCQPEKTKLAAEVDEALAFAAHVRSVDARLGRDPGLVMLTESLGVSFPGSETGMLVRDLAPLRDGHFYLPAFAIPFVGAALAAVAGERFAAFWAAGYAEPVGRAKAKLLARYGLQYQTPNPQNLLVQLDRRLRPTGAIALRDLADTDFATDAARSRGSDWTRLTANLAPETENSFWAFEQAPGAPIDERVLAHWYARHDRAYLDELCRLRDLPECGSLAVLAERLGRAA